MIMEKKGIEKALEIARLVTEAGGRAYYVGGYVRDRVRAELGQVQAPESPDIDIEVHGLEPAVLKGILESAGTLRTQGLSFGIYSLAGYDIDIAMPRSEHATGRGHRDFEVFVDPFIGPQNAARRRDFTINAMMEDVLTGEILDFYGGRDDVSAGVIRHVDDGSFAEDPLRVLRAAQFAARFGYAAAPETVELCRNMDLTALSRERVSGELEKALLKAPKPSVFFETLQEMDQLDFWFPELKALIGVEQDPVYHPEGDVWIHTMEVVDRAACYRDNVSEAYAFMLLALTHDMGKAVTTAVGADGRIHAYGHETAGLPLVEAFAGRLTNEKKVLSYLKNMVPLHMRPNMAAYSKSPVKKTNKMFDDALAPQDLVYFAMCDLPVMAGTDAFSGDSAFLFERLEVYREYMARPHVEAKDLVDAGFQPGPFFKDALDYAQKLRLVGIDKDSALKQTIAYTRQLEKKAEGERRAAAKGAGKNGKADIENAEKTGDPAAARSPEKEPGNE